MNRYRLKQPEVEMRTYRKICIRCGKSEIATVIATRPIPNPAYSRKPTWVDCMTGNHFFYPEHSIEPVAKK